MSNNFDFDMDIDDIDDLPAFTSLPAGGYIVRLDKGLEKKEINGKRAIEMAMTVVDISEVIESSLDKGEALPRAGDIATLSFMLDNEFGQGNLKVVLAAIKAAVSVTTVAGAIEESKGMEFCVAIKRRKGKKGTDKEDTNYMQIANIYAVT